MTHYMASDGAEFFSLIATYLTAEDQDFVRRGFELAHREHGDVRRNSGEPYIIHPLTIAYFLAEYEFDAPTLVAALLHDVAEDTTITIADITEQFGEEVGRLVDGVTKFEAATDDSDKTLSKKELTNETLRKLFEVMVDDVRVGIIKIFDRLHNMRTIGANRRESQVRNSNETLAVYAPLANRLGMWKVKTELEALSLEMLDKPNFYLAQIERQRLRHQHSPLFSQVHAELAAHFTNVAMPFESIEQQLESISSIYKASRINGAHTRINLDGHLRIIIVVKDVSACYCTLGYVHQLWRPVQGRFDDYIAAPRANLYQSLHTTVIHDGGQRIKIRVQTEKMNTLAQIGILAQWRYKDEPLWSQVIDQRMKSLIEGIRGAIEGGAHDTSLVVQDVVEDVFANQIIVYTPTGDMKELPKGATPLDFAYTIHTDVGAQCRQAYVNGAAVALNVALKDGDWVRVVKDGTSPKRVWLDKDLGYLTTSRAYNQVQRWFRKLPLEVALLKGRKILASELGVLGLENLTHDEVAVLLGFGEVAMLYHALGRAELLPTEMATQLVESQWQLGGLKQVGAVVCDSEGEAFVVLNAGERLVVLCDLCLPRPDDIIQGYLDQNEQVTVHQPSCVILQDAPQIERRLKLNWGEALQTMVKEVPVRVEVYDRPGLIFEITELIRQDNINLTEVHAQTTAGQAGIQVVLEIKTPRQLVAILHQMIAMVNVRGVRCVQKLSQQIW